MGNGGLVKMMMSCNAIKFALPWCLRHSVIANPCMISQSYFNGITSLHLRNVQCYVSLVKTIQVLK